MAMHPVTRLVLRTIREHRLVAEKDRVAAAVSGGADSVALAFVLRDLEAAGHLGAGLAGLIHVNHGLRGAEAARDEDFCRRLADRLRLPIQVAHVDVAALARASRRSIEAAARDARYQFFREAATTLGATAVATGHTLDDQAETVILRLLRGAGSRGLAGIRVRRGCFIRPLLATRRADLRLFLESRGEAFCEDSSNDSLDIARNRVRHQVLPVLAGVSPAGVEALGRLAALAADDEDYLEGVVDALAPSVISSGADGVQVHTGTLTGLAPSLARRVVRRALEEVAPDRACLAAHVEAVLALARAPEASGHLDLPGTRAERQGLEIVIKSAASTDKVWARPAAFEVKFPVPGRADVPEANVSLVASVQQTGPDVLNEGSGTAVLQAGTLALPLTVRSRRPGDRLRPFGAPGRRKLQDLLVDRKIPRLERDRLPIVVDAEGRIVWVVGVAIAEECRVTSPSAGVVVLKANKSS